MRGTAAAVWSACDVQRRYNDWGTVAREVRALNPSPALSCCTCSSWGTVACEVRALNPSPALSCCTCSTPARVASNTRRVYRPARDVSTQRRYTPRSTASAIKKTSRKPPWQAAPAAPRTWPPSKRF
jgi:hypothetical protein